jgi:hypothetical protein
MTETITAAPAGEAESTPEPDPRQPRFLALLRDVRDLLAEHPEMPVPYVNPDSSLQFCCGTSDVIADTMRTLRGQWVKNPIETDGGGGCFAAEGKWRGYTVSLTAPRDAVCTRVVVGVEDRPVDVVVTPAVYETVIQPVEVVEWRCGSVLAPADESAPVQVPA